MARKNPDSKSHHPDEFQRTLLSRIPGPDGEPTFLVPDSTFNMSRDYWMGFVEMGLKAHRKLREWLTGPKGAEARAHLKRTCPSHPLNEHFDEMLGDVQAYSATKPLGFWEKADSAEAERVIRLWFRKADFRNWFANLVRKYPEDAYWNGSYRVIHKERARLLKKNDADRKKGSRQTARKGRRKETPNIPYGGHSAKVTLGFVKSVRRLLQDNAGVIRASRKKLRRLSS